jgi:hypothetical protein
MLADEAVGRERKGHFRSARVLGVLKKLVDEVRAVGIEVLEDVEVDFPAIGVEAVDELAAALNQSLEVCAVLLSARHRRPPS